MAGIEVPVSSPGLVPTADGFGKLATNADRAATGMMKTSAQADKMSKSFASLKQKMGSGEVIRNTAASFALMATQGNGAMEKVAGLSGALASIPGPIGMVAAGMAAAATIFNVYSKSAEEAAKKTEDLKKEVVALGQAKGAAQKTLADAVGGAAKAHGMGLRKAMSMGASQEDIGTGLSLTGGDAAESLGIAGSLGAAKLDAAGKADVVDRLKALRDMGVEISSKVVDEAIKQKEYELEASKPQSAEDAARATEGRRAAALRGGGIFGPGGGTPRETGSAFTQSVLELGGRDSSNNDAMLNRFNASRSQAGRHNAMLLDAAEAPAIADTNRQFRDAFRGTGTVEAEALRVSTLANTTSTDNLTKAITDLDVTIKAKTAEAKSSGGTNDEVSVDAMFKYGKDAAKARR